MNLKPTGHLFKGTIMEKQDVDKLEQVIDAGKAFTAVGEKIFANGKIDFADVEHTPELFRAAEKMIGALKNYKELGLEIKDIDGSEAIRLLSKLVM